LSLICPSQEKLSSSQTVSLFVSLVLKLDLGPIFLQSTRPPSLTRFSSRFSSLIAFDSDCSLFSSFPPPAGERGGHLLCLIHSCPCFPYILKMPFPPQLIGRCKPSFSLFFSPRPPRLPSNYPPLGRNYRHLSCLQSSFTKVFLFPSPPPGGFFLNPTPPPPLVTELCFLGSGAGTIVE